MESKEVRLEGQEVEVVGQPELEEKEEEKGGGGRRGGKPRGGGGGGGGLPGHSTRQRAAAVLQQSAAAHFHNRKGQCCGCRDTNTMLSGSSATLPETLSPSLTLYMIIIRIRTIIIHLILYSSFQ